MGVYFCPDRETYLVSAKLIFRVCDVNPRDRSRYLFILSFIVCAHITKKTIELVCHQTNNLILFIDPLEGSLKKEFITTGSQSI